MILKITENKSAYTLCQVGGSLEQYHYGQSSLLLKAEAQIVSNHVSRLSSIVSRLSILIFRCHLYATIILTADFKGYVYRTKTDTVKRTHFVCSLLSTHEPQWQYSLKIISD